MNGPRHQPTYLDVVTFENEIDRHHKRLGEIHNGVSRRKNIDRDAINAKFGGREKVLKFHNSEKALAIEKDNELLLGRLVEISRKRQNPLFPLKEKEPNIASKSLNSNYRKKEKDRIAAENEAFARRLLSQQPSFNRRKLDDDYDRHSERVRLMQKAGGFSNKIKLPPISYSKYEDIDRKSQSGKEKRSIKELGKKKRRKSLKMEKLNEDEKEDMAEQEEKREKDESERLLKEAREQREHEEAEREEKEERERQELAEKNQREQLEREQAERKAQQEHENTERLKREEEERVKLEAQKNKNPSETNVGNPAVKK